jgi:uncharacterized protein YdaU (DUF1376 family)
MNYYPFHVGDYASATRHLSWDEDAAYRRLLDAYYIAEKALPSDLRAVCRLVLATTDAQREAVKVVLEEFFCLTQSGWENRRADAEIQVMREKRQKQRDKAKKRWLTQKEERGITDAMPRHDDAHAAASKNHADAMPPTPTPTPIPTPIPKDEIQHTQTLSEVSCVRELPSPTDAGRVCLAMRQAGIPDCNPGHPELLALLAAGATVAEFVGAAASASGRGKGFAYAIGTLKRQRTDAALAAQGLHRGPMPDAPQRKPTAAEMRVLHAVPSIAAPHLRSQVANPAPFTIDAETIHAAPTSALGR